jgi:iron complex outermembrane receptor protein
MNLLQQYGRRCGVAGAMIASLVLLIPGTGWPQTVDQQNPPASTNQAQPAAGQQAQQGTQPQKPQQEQQKPKQETQKPTEEQQVPRIDTQVFVTAPRLDVPLKDNPAATSVVGDPVLRSMPRDIGAEEALQAVPGMKVDNQADGERVHMSIRGQGLLTERGVRGITVLLDGLPLNDPTGFAPDLFDIDWASVGRIEVLRGVASALYGGSSAGGVVNVVTRDGGKGAAQGQAGLTFGQYNFWKPYAEVGGTRGDLNYRVSASLNNGDGYRLHTNFDAYNLYGKVRYTVSAKTQITAIIAGTHYFNQNAEGLNLAWTPEGLGQDVPWDQMANPDSLTYNEYQRTSRFTMGMSGRTQLADNQDLTFDAYYRRTYWTESVPSSVIHRTYDTPGGNIQYTIHSGNQQVKNHLSFGSDISWQGFDDYRYPNMGDAVEGTTLLSNQTISQTGIAVYALDRIEIGPRWGLMVGVRGDRIDNQLTDLLKAGGTDLSGDASFSKATGRFGVSFNPRSDVGLYASVGQGFLPPATEELANNPDAFGGFNTHLVPATSVGEEFGVRGSFNAFTYDISFFHLTTDNDFGRYRVASRPLETFYGNLGNSRRYGLETELGYYPTAHLALRGAYTFSDFLYPEIQFIFDSFTNTVMPNSPRHQVTLDAEYSVNGHWVIGGGLFGQTMQYVDPGNTMTADGFALFTPRLGYRWQRNGYQGEVMLQSRNVFGDHYMAFTEPDPDGNSYHPGSTRETFVSLRIVFGGK